MDFRWIKSYLSFLYPLIVLGLQWYPYSSFQHLLGNLAIIRRAGFRDPSIEFASLLQPRQPLGSWGFSPQRDLVTGKVIDYEVVGEFELFFLILEISWDIRDP